MKRWGYILVVAIGMSAVSPARSAAPKTDAALAAHLLNRLGFGARAGDVDRVVKMGALAYIDQQLHPERIDDRAVAKRLAGFTTVGLSSQEIAERYEAPLIEARQNRKADAAKSTPPLPDDERKRVAAPETRLAALPLMELSQQKILRATFSNRQLEEALVDFWFNHFNVDARKGPDRFLLTEYEREAIRPHVLGKFRDLLGATAKSPAMLFYLDNWMSAAPEGAARVEPKGNRRALRRGVAAFPRRPPPSGNQAANRMPRGLNENYGRELLELHTLGVNGGYTQKDVTEVARAFTGWSIAGSRQGGAFRFVPQLHDDGEKVILGHTIKAGGGERDGEQVLDILAAHPSTAAFIARTLAERFVSDQPSPALVARAASAFTKTQGDLRAVMRTLLMSDEFLSRNDYGAKVKTPFDFIVSALRATDAEISDARPLVRAMQELGMPLYQCQPPTGYKDAADTWVNTGALVNRMNIALSIANGRMAGTTVSANVDPVALAGPGASDATKAVIAKATSAPQAIALALGAPEFQRR